MSDSNNNRVDVAGFSKVVSADAEVFVNEEGKPTAVSHENPLPVSIGGVGGPIPFYDTLVESSTTVFTNGGTLSFFQGGPSGTKVAELTITVAGGARTTQRTA